MTSSNIQHAKWLAMDFSVSGATLALKQGRGVKCFEFKSLMRKSGKFFNVLNKELNLSKRGGGLDYICVGIGPGSFTGIRLSVSIAKTIAYAMNVKLIPIPSPLFIAAEYESATRDELLGVIQDAKRGNVYLTYIKSQRIVAQPRLCAMDDLANALKPNCTYLGDGLKRISQRFEQKIEGCYWKNDLDIGQPRGLALEKIAVNMGLKMTAIAPMELKPIYLYKDSCTVTPRAKASK